jgi:hypothetical protein
VAELGSESISSASEELMAGSMKLSLLLIDMAGAEAWAWAWAWAWACVCICKQGGDWSDRRGCYGLCMERLSARLPVDRGAQRRRTMRKSRLLQPMRGGGALASLRT